MSGARSSHWSPNALAPPMPTGPTMSGGSPLAILVASASRAWRYGTPSKATWMFEWVALKSLTTCCSTATCSGELPAPRQQNQRTSVTPGGTDAGPVTNVVGWGDGLASGDCAHTGAAEAASSPSTAD